MHHAELQSYTAYIKNSFMPRLYGRPFIKTALYSTVMCREISASIGNWFHFLVQAELLEIIHSFRFIFLLLAFELIRLSIKLAEQPVNWRKMSNKVKYKIQTLIHGINLTMLMGKINRKLLYCNAVKVLLRWQHPRAKQVFGCVCEDISAHQVNRLLQEYIGSFFHI